MKIQEYKPGEIAPVSGIYAVIDHLGRKTSERRPVTEGTPFPPTVQPQAKYRLIERIETVYTSASSTSIMTGTSTEYSDLLKRLAKK